MHAGKGVCVCVCQSIRVCLCVCSYAPNQPTNQPTRAPTHAVCALPLPVNSTAKTPPATRRKPPHPSSPPSGAPTPGSVNQPCADGHLWGFGPFTITNSATTDRPCGYSIFYFLQLNFRMVPGPTGKSLCCWQENNK